MAEDFSFKLFGLIPIEGIFDIDSIFKLGAHLIKKAIDQKRTLINYNFTEVISYYANSKLNLIKFDENNFREKHLPFDIYYEFPNRINKSHWGTFKSIETYQFPFALELHKDKMIKLFQKKGVLTKSIDEECLRVSNFYKLENSPHFELNKIPYSYQIGTNLSIDYKFNKPIKISDSTSAITVRDYDIAYNKNNIGDLPGFDKSILANTIGVCVLLVAKDKKGKVHVLARKRTKTVAVYPDMWSSPLSFSLNATRKFNRTNSIYDIIIDDLDLELQQETGLSRKQFRPVKPLVFGRDLLRGGKPQFYLLLEYTEGVDSLIQLISSHKTIEFQNNVEIGIKEQLSPEFRCGLVYINKRLGIIN